MIETTLLPKSVEAAEIVYRDKIQQIQRVIARFDHFTKEYFVSDHGRRAALLVIRNREILLVRQYRLLMNCISLEIPGGRVEPNETPLEAALRECYEETGALCSTAIPLLEYQASLDVLKNPTFIFYSHQLATEPKSSERYVWTPLAECLKMAFQGAIADSLTIIALFSYLLSVDADGDRDMRDK